MSETFNMPSAIIDAIYQTPLTPTQRDIIWSVVRLTYRLGRQTVEMTIKQVAEYSQHRRSEVSPAFNDLVERNIVSATKCRHGFILQIADPDLWLHENPTGHSAVPA